MLEEADKLLPRAPILNPRTTTRWIPEHRSLARAVALRGGNPTAAVQREITRAASMNSSNELFDDPYMRQGTQGLGYVLPLLRGRNLHDKETWDMEGFPAKYIQVFSWNAGNLQRIAQGDTLNDLLAS